jgi:ATP-dependent helicase/nuclease subunit A
MNNGQYPAELSAEFRATEDRQARAADPARSAWVSANAGTGKTHVLTTRVLRLLVAGTPPERLLCLTYTKAAAAVMSSRVFDRLAQWVTADDADLEASLGRLVGRKPTREELERSRDLFTRAIETPGGLKVQTIHAFCERLLQRFPLEAGVPPGFSILDEEMRSSLIRQATGQVLEAATNDRRGDLGQALATVVRYATDDSFDKVLSDAMSKRDWLEAASRIEHGEGQLLDGAARLYRQALGVTPGDTAETVEAARAGVLSDAVLVRARDVMRGGTKTDSGLADTLGAAVSAPSQAARSAALAGFFMTAGGEPRKKLMTVKLAAEHTELAARLEAAQAEFIALEQRLGRIVVVEATMAVMRLSFAAMRRYHDLKQQRAALDFDDLIRAAGGLLQSGDDAQWVLYKLDGGLDHILVDEAQDTSPTQWRVIEALAREFLAGEGARELETGGPRTVFAVGDEKQSIYGFQGAAPKMFADMGQRFQRLAEAARLPFERVPLTLSFRTVAPILDAVDRVFADPVRGAGLTSTGEVARHVAHRFAMGGLVEVWDTEKPDESDPAPVWRPLDEVAQAMPASRLADRIAETIAGWLTRGDMLVSEGRPLRSGDILILVRKRRPFADLMVSALKRRGIPVAGADRLRLGDQLAVRDLMALFDVLLLPEDDLALASVLKSPLIGLDEDDLLAIAHGRRGSLWTALLAMAGETPRFLPAVDRLKRWRKRADVSPPYEFLVEVLVHDGMRERLISRLGPEAAEAIDELVSLALNYDEQAPPSLQGFMDWLRAADREVKRDMEHGRDEVRVLTVHGSKGLEAPVVILPDTCTAPTAGRPGGLVGYPDMAQPAEGQEPFLWPVKGTSKVDAVAEARDAVRRREMEEHNRLLYVALTRPRDRLYVAGFEGPRGRDKGSWYEAVLAGLDGVLTEAIDSAGRSVRRLELAQGTEPKAASDDTHAVIEPLAPPAWARTDAPREPGLALPIAPSRLAPLESDAEGDPVEPRRIERRHDEPPAPSPTVLAEGNRFLRGTITHALLQHLPGLATSDRKAAAEAFVEARAAPLSQRARSSIVAETLAVLAHPAFGPVFGPGSRAEVPIAAEIAPPDGVGRRVRLTGQIDRIVDTGGDVLIVDFKTNRPPPMEVADVSEAYVLQLAAYRLALARIFPERVIRAALLWTDGPRLMELPADRLDAAAGRLFVEDRMELSGES